jgi:hypothetical protein
LCGDVAGGGGVVGPVCAETEPSSNDNNVVAAATTVLHKYHMTVVLALWCLIAQDWKNYFTELSYQLECALAFNRTLAVDSGAGRVCAHNCK